MPPRKKKRKKKKKGRQQSLRRLAAKNRALWQLIGPGNSNSKQRHAMINKLSRKNFADIGTLLRAFMLKKIPVDCATLSRLKRDKKYLYALANRNVGLSTKRKIIKQKGGFLPFLLAPLIAKAAVGAIAGGLFKR